MAKKSRFDGIIVTRNTDDEGYIHAYDKDDRQCWDRINPERVVLTEDLRRYAAGLHKGQLGWTIPGSTDGYKWVDVQFDNGPRIPVLTFGLERVAAEKAVCIADSIIDACRGTRFDIDPTVAEAKRQELIRKEYGSHIDSDDLVELGNGPHEVYAYSFPSLVELARLKGVAHYPVKVGYTADKDIGSFTRIRSQVFEDAAYPERIKLLIIYRCEDGRRTESKMHRLLRRSGRKIKTAVGREWFFSSHEELVRAFRSLFEKEPIDLLNQNGLATADL